MIEAIKQWFRKFMPVSSSISGNANDANTQYSPSELIKIFKQKFCTATQYISRSPDIVVGCIFVLGFIVLLFLGFNQNTHLTNLANLESKNRTLIINRLNDITNQVQQLSTDSPDTGSYKTQLTQIVDELSGVQKLVSDTAKSTDIQRIATQLTSMQTDIDSQMGDIKKSISQTDNRNYVDPSVLPFKVLSIDMLSQQPFISIDYANHISPLSIGDTMAGWRVMSADYEAAQVEFKNTQDKYVKVILQY